MARNEKDALILILDVGMSMATKLVNSSSTYLQTCVDIIQMIIQRKIFQSSKDEIGLILYGTNETANDLWNSETDHYSHIVLARPLCQVDWKLLEYVQNNINSTLLDGDVLDAITVAMDHLHNQSLERKFKEKRIILLTSYSSLSSDENIKEIRDALKSDEIRLDIVSPFNEPGKLCQNFRVSSIYSA
jgi:ATP-dependent DNA helicase 2 subunit 2